MGVVIVSVVALIDRKLLWIGISVG